MNKRLLAILLVVAVLAGVLAMGAFAEEQKDPIRIFTIGNSHGNDSTWQLARVFAAQDPDREVIVGTMYYSGCAMERHVRYAYSGAKEYTYHKNVNGVWTSTKNCDLATGLADEPWDIVVLQEMNVRSGQEVYFQNDDIEKLMAFVDSKLENEHKFYWNFIWANPVDQTFWDPSFDPQPPIYDDLPGESWVPRYESIYGTDQVYMYEQMVANVNKYILTNDKIHDVLPAGTAIQYANHMLGQTDVDLYRDYTHMSDLGRLIVAYTWYAQITGESIDEVLVDMVPAAERPTHRQTALGDFTVTAEMKQVIKDAANYAMEHPLEVPKAPAEALRCDQCRYEPEWTAWDGSNLPEAAGHYYLTGDVTLEFAQVFSDTEEAYAISINLNGHTLTGKDRLFEVGGGVTVSIMDGAGGGKVIGPGNAANGTADIALVNAGGTFCLHSGELTAAQSGDTYGLVDVAGTLTVRGGTISDGNAATESDVWVGSTGTLDICDGRIDSVGASGYVKAARKAVIGSLALFQDTVPFGDLLTVTGNFEGQIGLSLHDPEAEFDVGNGDGAAFGEGAVYLVGNEDMGVVLQGTDLVLKEATLCGHCEKKAVWIPIDETWQTNKVLNGGHYYLAFAADSYAMTERTVTAGHSVCLDLNGKGYVGTYRAFKVAPGATLTLLGNGWVSGRGTEAGEDGGVIYVAEGATLNLYEGTIRSDLGGSGTRYATRGGVLGIDGTFNMYGGKVRGDSRTTDKTPLAWPTLGGVAYVGPTGTMNITGGTINDGTVAEDGIGQCVYANGTVCLSAAPTVAGIYLAEDTANSGIALGDMLVVGGAFTGTAVLELAEPVDGLDVGNLIGGGDPGSGITVKGLDMAAKAQGEDLVLKSVIVCDHCATEPQWTAWDGSTPTESGHYYLASDLEISEQTLENVDFVLDLRGKTLTGTGRAFQVNSGASLAVLDTAGGGKLQAAGAAGEKQNGGVVLVAAGGSFELYGGELTLSATHNNPYIGGIIHNSGTVSIYGGNIHGGAASLTADTIYSGKSATLYIGGGTISGPDCLNTVYVRGAVTLSGAPEINPGIRLVPQTGGPALEAMVTVEGNFTGSAAISADEIAKNVDIGAASGATIAEGSLTVSGSTDLQVVEAGGELMIAGTAYCQHCQKNVLWTPVKNVTYWQTLSSLGSGHYSMAFSGTAYPMAVKTIASDNTVCIDLNGKHIQGTNQAYKVQANAVLNIMGEGKVTGRGNASHTNGGTIYVAENGTLNLYGGTLGTEIGIGTVQNRYPTNGGIVAVDGIFNMYGGSIDAVSAYTPNGWPVLGGAVYVGKTGVMNMSSGTANSGTIDASGSGESIYVSGKLNLSGDATADEVELAPVTDGPALAEMLNITGTYTGSITLALPDPVSGVTVGTATDCILANECLTVNDVDGLAVYNMNGLLVAWDGSAPFVVSGPSGFAGGFDDSNAAVAACGEDQAIILMTEVDMPLALTKDLTVDLNGSNLITETTGNYTLYIKDSFTDDYDITADVYGRTYGVLSMTGSAKVAAAPGYVKITDGEEVSFHKVGLDIKSMSLRPEEAGLYFNCDFLGDPMVAQYVDSFGVALSVTGDPDETTLENPKHFTRFEKEAFGTENTSTLLTGILKDTSGYNTNQQRARIQVYGRAYIEVDGAVVFGDTKARSLREQLEGIDGKWEQLSNSQKRGVLDLYGQYGRIMDKWTMPNFQAEQAEEEDVLRVLSIGNSYSHDSANMLHKVFQSQNPDKKVQIAVLYNAGCSLAEHVGYIEGYEAEYDYSYTNSEGKWIKEAGVTMDVGLKDQQWDIVVMQEASAKSGEPENYQADNIEKIQVYVLDNVAIAPEFYWNLTWAWPQDPALRAEDYDPQPPAGWETKLEEITNFDQMYQYGKITSCVQNYILTRDSFVKVFPTGTAIQYANNMLGLDDLDLYRDYTHLNDYGRLIAAHVWYARLMGLEELTEVNVDVIPASERLSRFQQYGDLVITEEMKQQILDAVNWALENPYTVPGSPS